MFDFYSVMCFLKGRGPSWVVRKGQTDSNTSVLGCIFVWPQYLPWAETSRSSYFGPVFHAAHLDKLKEMGTVHMGTWWDFVHCTRMLKGTSFPTSFLD